MRNGILKSACLLALCLPTLALAQERRGKGTWEFSAGGGLKVMDAHLQDFLCCAPPPALAANRFTYNTSPDRLMPGIALRLGYNFSRQLGWSIGGEAARGSGVTYLTPLAAITYTPNLDARTSPFISIGTQGTRIYGKNGRRTHPTWGGHVGVGFRQMFKPDMAFRVEGRIASEHYAELPGAKAAYPAFVTLGVSYFMRSAADSRQVGQPAP